MVEFRKGFPILNVDSDLHEITIGGDQHTLWSQGDQVKITFSLKGELTSVSYEILESRVSGGDTTLVTKKSPRPDLEGGEVIISKTFEVLRVLGNKVQVHGGEEVKAIDAMQQFFQMEFFDLEGSHLFEHILLRPKYKGSYTYPDEIGNPVSSTIEDRLIDPHFQEECDCTLDDPYTCMGHLILPFWAGRFTNRDFRKFLEKKDQTRDPGTCLSDSVLDQSCAYGGARACLETLASRSSEVRTPSASPFPSPPELDRSARKSPQRLSRRYLT